MPKKTKREKIIAEYRRKIQGVQETIALQAKLNYELPKTKKAASPSHATVIAVAPMDPAIRRDLIKTIFLAVVAISGEVLLSKVIDK